MKKTILTLSIAIASHFCYAQWTTSGSNIYPLTLTNNVGIGTPSPSAKLDVNGSTNINGNLNIANTLAYGRAIISTSETKNNSTSLAASSALFLSTNETDTPFGAQFRVVGNTVPEKRFLSIQTGEHNVANNGNISLQLYGGNVGIGTSTPTTKLDIAGTVGSNDVKFENYSPTTTGDENQSLIFTGSDNSGAGNGNFELLRMKVTSTNGGRPTSNVQFIQDGGSIPSLVFDANANVGIGTADPKGYKLAVNGSAIAESVTVKLHSNWPDYVFKPQYSLPSLKDIKTYIDQNQHLPDMPSEAEVAKNGINLGEIVKIQTKKIEELTLYLIEQQGINRSLQTQIDQLAKKN